MLPVSYFCHTALQSPHPDPYNIAWQIDINYALEYVTPVFPAIFVNEDLRNRYQSLWKGFMIRDDVYLTQTLMYYQDSFSYLCRDYNLIHHLPLHFVPCHRLSTTAKFSEVRMIVSNGYSHGLYDPFMCFTLEDDSSENMYLGIYDVDTFIT